MMHVPFDVVTDLLKGVHRRSTDTPPSPGLFARSMDDATDALRRSAPASRARADGRSPVVDSSSRTREDRRPEHAGPRLPTHARGRAVGHDRALDRSRPSTDTDESMSSTAIGDQRPPTTDATDATDATGASSTTSDDGVHEAPATTGDDVAPSTGDTAADVADRRALLDREGRATTVLAPELSRVRADTLVTDLAPASGGTDASAPIVTGPDDAAATATVDVVTIATATAVVASDDTGETGPDAGAVAATDGGTGGANGATAADDPGSTHAGGQASDVVVVDTTDGQTADSSTADQSVVRVSQGDTAAAASTVLGPADDISATTTVDGGATTSSAATGVISAAAASTSTVDPDRESAVSGDGAEASPPTVSTDRPGRSSPTDARPDPASRGPLGTPAPMASQAAATAAAGRPTGPSPEASAVTAATPAVRASADIDIDPTGLDRPPAVPGALGPSTSGSPAPSSTASRLVSHSSIAARVEAAVEALRTAPPPREAVLDVDGVRITVRLVGETVQVQTGGQPMDQGQSRDLAQALAGRGLALAADSGDAQDGGDDDRDAPSDATDTTAAGVTTTATRPTPDDTDALRL